jgi:D-aminopeptidase
VHLAREVAVAGFLAARGAPVVAPTAAIDPGPQEDDAVRLPPAGSCIVVLATDAPLGAVQLQRVARRAGLGLGLARSGSVAHHGSGEIFLAFASGPTGGAVADDALDPIFACTVEATEEAVLNALWFARDMRGRDGRLVRALPHDDAVALLDAHGGLDRPLR